MRSKGIVLAAAGIVALSLVAGCASIGAKNAKAEPAKAEKAAAAAPAKDAAMAAVLAGDWRSEANKARDSQRHPAETLEFWGLKPGMRVIELAPGGGWWTEILAPYAAKTGGTYVATGADLNNPDLPERSKKARADFEAKYAAKPDVFGKVEVVNFGPKSGPLGPADSADIVITARNIHSFMGQEGWLDKVMADSFAVLKPGGVLAVKEHRADPGKEKPKVEDGYVEVVTVVKAAEKAGFKLVAQSEINANLKDTKDHPFGVWTLPPVLRTAPAGGPPNPLFDNSKYKAIGESDRMTLRFEKPKK